MDLHSKVRTEYVPILQDQVVDFWLCDFLGLDFLLKYILDHMNAVLVLLDVADRIYDIFGHESENSMDHDLVCPK